MSYDPNQNGIDKSDYTRDNREGQSAPRTPPPYPHHPHITYGGHKPRKPSRFILLMLAFLPGLGHMYLGLIRRGLFYLAGTAFLVFLTVQFAMTIPLMTILTGFSIFALMAVGFFEGFALRRDMVAGKEVVDALPKFITNKTILVAIGAVLVIAILASIISSVPWIIWVIAGVAVVIFASKKKKGA
ncbi:MAG: hypothetical protein FWB98_05180 [Defluviitaleaceae bacterium]|nr:hypothetical protein [Defluviitaleaceae bacterium]